MVTHYDLFAGIGGFSIAIDEVFRDEGIRHVFCEWEAFPTAVLKQHWSEGIYYGDIAELVADTERNGLPGHIPQDTERQDRVTHRERRDQEQDLVILTGGFPCQPFSHAGRRKGTADDRYKWPEMFEVIKNVKPKWVIAENVRGLVTWNDGMVLEQVCTDLESQGYEVQPLIIPACAVNAPHRRDRVWIIGNAAGNGRNGAKDRASDITRSNGDAPGAYELLEPKGTDSLWQATADTRPQRRSARREESLQPARQEPSRQEHEYPDWRRDWQEVALTTCNDAMDDGLPRLVDGVPISRAKWRKDSLKAYGNGIVSQVAMEIVRAIAITEAASN